MESGMVKNETKMCGFDLPEKSMINPEAIIDKYL